MQTFSLWSFLESSFSAVLCIPWTSGSALEHGIWQLPRSKLSWDHAMSKANTLLLLQTWCV